MEEPAGNLSAGRKNGFIARSAGPSTTQTAYISDTIGLVFNLQAGPALSLCIGLERLFVPLS
jgi:hypothetical protein